MSRLLVSASNAFFGVVNRLLALFGRAPVAEISVEKLVRLQNQQGTRDFVLVDVRDAAEYSVSVIPGAITKEQFEANRESHRDQLIVAYCTVGGRSYLYARKLQQQGFKVANFKPSIIGWCEANHPLVTLDDAPTNRVHVYSRAFTVPEHYEAVTTEQN